MTKQQSFVIIVGCLLAVLMCIGVIVIVQQSAQAVVGESDSGISNHSLVERDALSRLNHESFRA